MCTVVRNSLQGRSRTARSLQSYTSMNLRPQPEHSSLRFPRLRRTHKSRVFLFSLISYLFTIQRLRLEASTNAGLMNDTRPSEYATGTTTPEPVSYIPSHTFSDLAAQSPNQQGAEQVITTDRRCGWTCLSGCGVSQP